MVTTVDDASAVTMSVSDTAAPSDCVPVEVPVDMRGMCTDEIPDGMLQAFEYYADELNEVVGLSIWDSPESREAYRLSDVEARRRQAMAPYVVHEHSGFYVGRELRLPR